MEDAPAGACILYAVSCGQEPKNGDDEVEDDLERGDNVELIEGTGSKVRLKAWQLRKRKSLGVDYDGRPGECP
jgi:hypothetical protein